MANLTCRIQIMVDEDFFVRYCNAAFDARSDNSTLGRELLMKAIDGGVSKRNQPEQELSPKYDTGGSNK
jgi:hypothetical protein